MNKIDIENLKSILEWRELERKVKAGPNITVGGDLDLNTVMSHMTDKEIEEYIKDFEENEKKAQISKIKSLVDELFEKYGTENSNIILLSGAYYPSDSDSRHVCEREDIINDVDWNGFDRKYNKLYYPCAIEKLPADDWYSTHELPEKKRKSIRAQWDKYYNDLYPLSETAHNLGIPTAKEYYKDDNSALNELWYGVIGIMKDYKVVSFVIRDDGMLCNEDSYESWHNKVLMKL